MIFVGYEQKGSPVLPDRVVALRSGDHRLE